MARSEQTKGSVERIHRTVLDEFFRLAFRQTLYQSVEEFQRDLDTWLTYYNRGQPHQRYRNIGKRPIDTVNAYLNKVTSADPVQELLTRLVRKGD